MMPSGFEAAGADRPSIQVFGCDVPHILNVDNHNPESHSTDTESPALSGPSCLEPVTLTSDSRPSTLNSALADSKPEPTRSAAANTTAASASQSTPNESSARVPQALHRIAEIRVQQGISERTLAKRMNVDVKCYREMEDPLRDLKLSELQAFQEALDVPLIDLLEDRSALSRPVQERAKLVKIMKTAVALREAQVNPRVNRMAEMLCGQLVDLMPELADVSGWPQFGARRGLSAIGKALQQPIDMSQLGFSE